MWNSVFFSFYLICSLELKSVYAAASILPPQPKPEIFACKIGCYIPERNGVLAYNETFSPQDGESCMEYNCNEDGNTYIYTCGVIAFPDYCTRVPGNRFLPYPTCCDGVFCPTTTEQPATTEATTAKGNCETGQCFTSPVEHRVALSPEGSPNPAGFNVPVEDPIKTSLKTSPNPDDLNLPLNPGPVLKLPVQPPGGESRVSKPDTSNDTSNVDSLPGVGRGPSKTGPIRTLPVEPPVES